jgi:hypothetical protein
VSIRWRVTTMYYKDFNNGGGSVGEPFAVIRDAAGSTLVLTKEQYQYEGDEDQSSTHDHNRQEERERG